MTTEQFMMNLSKIQGYSITDLVTDMLVRYGRDMVSDIANRVQETGKLSDGSKRNYSKRPALVGAKSFRTQGGFQSAMSDAKSDGSTHWVTIKKNGRTYRLILLAGGYAEIRQKDGQQAAHKDYSRTKEMWQGFGVKNIENKKITLGGTTEMSQNKINWNSQRDDINIIAPNEQEIKLLTEKMDRAIQIYIDDTLGN